MDPPCTWAFDGARDARHVVEPRHRRPLALPGARDGLASRPDTPAPHESRRARRRDAPARHGPHLAPIPRFSPRARPRPRAGPSTPSDPLPAAPVAPTRSLNASDSSGRRANAPGPGPKKTFPTTASAPAARPRRPPRPAFTVSTARDDPPPPRRRPPADPGRADDAPGPLPASCDRLGAERPARGVCDRLPAPGCAWRAAHGTASPRNESERCETRTREPRARSGRRSTAPGPAARPAESATGSGRSGGRAAPPMVPPRRGTPRTAARPGRGSRAPAPGPASTAPGRRVATTRRPRN